MKQLIVANHREMYGDSLKHSGCRSWFRKTGEQLRDDNFPGRDPSLPGSCFRRTYDLIQSEFTVSKRAMR